MSDNTENPGQLPEHLALAVSAGSAVVGPASIVVSDVLAGLAERALRAPRLRIHEWRETEKQLFRDVDKRLARRGVRNPVDPGPAVAIPAILGALCTGDELRGLFAELLTTALDPNTADQAHPAFADLIRQMLPSEAWLLASLRTKPGRMLLEARSTWAQGTNTTLGYMRPDNKNVLRREAVYIANLSRMGLVEVRSAAWRGESEIAHLVEACERVIQGQPALSEYHQDITSSAPMRAHGIRQVIEWAASDAPFSTEQIPRLVNPALPAPDSPRRDPRAATAFELHWVEATAFGSQFMKACIPEAEPPDLPE